MWISLHDNFSRTCQVLGTWASESDQLPTLKKHTFPSHSQGSVTCQRLEPRLEHGSSISHPNQEPSSTSERLLDIDRLCSSLANQSLVHLDAVGFPEHPYFQGDR